MTSYISIPSRYRAACIVALAIACSDPNPLTPVRRPDVRVAERPSTQTETWTYDLLADETDDGQGILEATGINDSGKVSGFDYSHAWRWDGAFVQTMPGFYAWGFGINNLGDIVGYVRNPPYYSQSALYWHFDPGGGSSVMVQLPHSDKNGLDYAEDINDSSYIVGYNGGDATPAYKAVLWRPIWLPPNVHAHQAVVLGPVGTEDAAVAINNAGIIVGQTKIGGRYRAWSYVIGGRPPAVLPLSPGYVESWPGDVNDSGVTVGVAKHDQPPWGSSYRIVTWTGSVGPTDLGLPPTERPQSAPYHPPDVRISRRGRIAGVAFLPGNDTVLAPFTYKSGVLTPLPTPLPLLPHDSGTVIPGVLVRGINSCGQIIGTFTDANYVMHLIRWRRTQNGRDSCD